MDSHRIGSRELLNIETPSIVITIKGSDSIPLYGSNNEEPVSMLKVVCDDDYDISIHNSSAPITAKFSGRSYVGEYMIIPLFYEQQRYEIVIEAKDNREVSFWHDNYNVRNKVSQVGKNHTLLTGVINFGNDIGLSDIVIMLDGRNYLKITIEVFPSKISYKDDYKAIVSDVTSEVYSLIFDFLKKTYSSFDISSKQQASMVEFFAIIKKLYDEMTSAADMVIRNPHHQLLTSHEVQPFHKIKRTDNKTIRWIEKHPEHVIRETGGIKADKAVGARKQVTYDTKENRLTKFMLERTSQRLVQFKNMYCKLDRAEDAAVLKQIDAMVSGIQRRCNTGFMKDVNATPVRTGMSLVFGMAPGYRELYRCYLLLQHGLSVTGSVFDLSVKDLAVLYEYWCFIKLNSLMRSRYKLISPDIIRVSGAGLYVSLVKGQPSTVRYLNQQNGEVITLSYNPKEISVPTITQRPDNVLKLNKKGSHIEYEYVFDAKYRINPALPESAYYNTIDKTPGPEVSDINTMHRYRDAIVYQNGASPFERTMFGAYVLFPYNDEMEYKNHRFFKSIGKVNIGGLPFLPSATELVSDLLDELISDSPESAFERAILPKGTEELLAKTNWEERDVLIGTINDNKQLDICLKHNCFYILKSKIRAARFPIRYVAVYQTKDAFGADAGIEYYGKVLLTQMMTQSAIPEFPGNNDEEYYCFEIEKWEKLSQPIQPKEVNFPVEYTNMFLLKHSAYAHELLLRSEEEYRFYTELRRRTEAKVINNEGAFSAFEFEGAKVIFNNGEIIVVKDDAIVNRSTIKEFARKPNAVFRKLFNIASFTE